MGGRWSKYRTLNLIKSSILYFMAKYPHGATCGGSDQEYLLVKNEQSGAATVLKRVWIDPVKERKAERLMRRAGLLRDSLSRKFSDYQDFTSMGSNSKLTMSRS